MKPFIGDFFKSFKMTQIFFLKAVDYSKFLWFSCSNVMVSLLV